MKDNRTKTTRDRIVEFLLYNQQCSIIELAEAVDISPISVRHHITKLLADGLVTSEEEKQGVGRPRLIYSLTEAGLELFPSRYLHLTLRLLQQLKNTLPKPIVSDLFSHMAVEMVAEYEDEVIDLPMEQRLDLVKTLLNKEGFTVEWEQEGEDYLIHEISCPYYHIGQSHPEVCSVDKTLLSSILAIPVKQVKCVLEGDARCTYLVSNPDNINNDDE